MKNNKKLYGILAVIAAAVLLFVVWMTNRPKPSAGAKNVIVEVKDDQEAVKKYEVNTDAEYLSGVMDELKAKGDFTYEASVSEYGMFITSINGLAADYEKDQAYWAIYVNGDYGQYVADQQPVTDKDTYSFVYEKQ